MIRSAKIRSVSTVLAFLAIFGLAITPADARKRRQSEDDTTQSDGPADTRKSDRSKSEKAKADKSKSDKKTEKKDGSGKPVQVATFGDWGAYLAKGRNKTCYTLASPQERKPDVKREAAYVFIADRPAEKVHQEVSIIMGFPMKENGVAQAKIGTASFDLVAKGSNAWIKNAKDEAKFVETLKRSSKLVVKAAPQRGPATTDTYALSGLKQALERVSKECK